MHDLCKHGIILVGLPMLTVPLCATLNAYYTERSLPAQNI